MLQIPLDLNRFLNFSFDWICPNVIGTILPQRIVVGIMGFFAIAVAYTIRACLSVTITEMVVDVEDSGEGHKLRSKVN